MRRALAEHLEQFGGLGADEVRQIVHYFVERQVPGRARLTGPDGGEPQLYYVEEGLLRLGHVDPSGQERTLQFALEGWWLADFMAFLGRSPSQFFVEMAEEGTVRFVSRADYERLLAEVPSAERYFRKVYERAYAASQRRHFLQETRTARERYESFVANYPEFVERIPQYMLASFLGLTPEYLSRLRKRRAARRT